MPKLDGIERAVARAVAGGGHPYMVSRISRRGDERGWLVSFLDAFTPAADAVFHLAIDDDATEDQTADGLLEKIRTYQRRDPEAATGNPG